MARAFFLLLVVANLIFFVWASNYLGIEDTGHEPARVRDQLQADRLAVVATDAAAPPQACRRIGPVAVLDAERFRIALGVQSGLKAVVRPIEETNYWVLIPPLSDKAAADKKAVELKHMGISEFLVVTDVGPYRNAISLGTFSNEETAKDLLDRLGKKGVRSARIDTKLRPTEKALVDVRGEAGLVTKGLADVLPATPPPVADCPPQ